MFNFAWFGESLQLGLLGYGGFADDLAPYATPELQRVAVEQLGGVDDVIGTIAAREQHRAAEAKYEATLGAAAQLGFAALGFPVAGALALDVMDVRDADTTALLANLGGDAMFGSLMDLEIGDWNLGDVLGTINQVSDVVNTVQGIQNLFDDQAAQYPVAVSSSGGGGGLMTDSGDMVPTMGSVGGAVAAGGVWLGSVLARAFGRGEAAAIFTGANGVRVRMAQLWPLVRKYGAQNVAGALGITVGALGTLLMSPEAQKPARRRAKGISARDVKTTRRTIRTLKKLVRMSGIRMGGGGGYYHRHGHYHRRRR